MVEKQEKALKIAFKETAPDASATPFSVETVTVSAPTEEKKPCLIIAGFAERVTTRTT